MREYALQNNGLSVLTVRGARPVATGRNATFWLEVGRRLAGKLSIMRGALDANEAPIGKQARHGAFCLTRTRPRALCNVSAGWFQAEASLRI